jgi:hypothetical protein
MLTVFLAAIMILAFTAGCGGGDEGGEVGTPAQQEPLAVDFEAELEAVEEGLVGTFASMDGLFMTFLEDGSFETDAFGDKTSGTYEVSGEVFGYEITLNFDDGSEDFASVVFVDGLVRGVSDPMGTQFIKQ